MKNILKKIKRIFTLIGAFLFTICSKVLALQPTYGVFEEYKEDYQKVTLMKQMAEGVKKTNDFPSILRVITLPIIIIIGVIVYVKKNKTKKNKTKKNVAIILMAVVLVILSVLGGFIWNYNAF